MSRLSVLNKTSRSKITEILIARLNSWSGTIFVESPEISISFNDDFFTTKLVTNNDAIFLLENGMLMIENHHEISNQLIQKSLVIDNANVLNEDEQFLKDLKIFFNDSLFESLLGQKKLTDKIVSSTNSQKIAYALCIKLQYGDVVMSIFVDIELLTLMGLYVPSHTHTSPSLTSRELAVANEKVNLKVKLQTVSLQLQELLELKKGDLIKLEHSLQQPILLETQDSTISVKAFLVKKNNRKALLLSR